MDYLEHVTSRGERWDQLGARYYGDASNYAGIMAANPDVLLTPTLPAGLTLVIPLIDAPPADVSDLPPWKQPATDTAVSA